MEHLASPCYAKERTFKLEFEIEYPEKKSKPERKRTRKQYKNPIFIALEWKRLFDEGRYSSQAELAREMGISRARVTQIMNLLKLDKGMIKKLVDLGGTLSSPIVTERGLRKIVRDY